MPSPRLALASSQVWGSYRLRARAVSPQLPPTASTGWTPHPTAEPSHGPLVRQTQQMAGLNRAAWQHTWQEVFVLRLH